MAADWRGGSADAARTCPVTLPCCHDFGGVGRRYLARRGTNCWQPGHHKLFATDLAVRNRIVFNLFLIRRGGQTTINWLQHSVGGVAEGLWGRLKNLPTSQAIVSAQGEDPAMIMALEPGQCKLRMVV